MGIAGGPNLNQDGLVFLYDVFDQDNSYKGEPTVNYVPGTYNYSLYAYVSGPVDTVILNEKNQSITAKRYTITNAVNTARARILPSGLATGVAYTFSFKWKYNGTTTASPSVGIDASKGNPEGGANNNSFTSQTTNTVFIGNGWYLSTYIFVFSSVPTGNCMLTFGIVTNTTAGYVGETFDIYEAQFEIKNHRTQYSNGTRSATQGLLDVVGTTQIDLTNVSFDSNAQIVFDGTNDYINIGSGTGINQLSGDFAISLWAMRTAGGNYGNLIGDYYTNNTGTTGEWQIMMGPSSQLNLYKVGSGYIISNTASGFSNNTWINVVVTRLGNLVTMYANSNVIATGTDSTSYGTVTGNLNIGIDGNNSSEPFPGNIASISIYKNRALSAQEVLQNYNATKSRFGLK